jgi:hypothetical protein
MTAFPPERVSPTPVSEHALALLPENMEQESENYDYIEPIAEHMFNRKKIHSLEKNLGSLRQASRAQHESMMKLEVDMKSAVSVEDLQRALGLALEEVDARMEEVFRDSNKRLLSFFARRDDVSELQGLVSKKVSWADHNTVLKKLSDLRMYVDTMVETAIVNHGSSINNESGRKADTSAGDESKADISQLNVLQSRLERLEVLCTHDRQEQSTALQTLADQTAAEVRSACEKQRIMIARTTGDLEKLKEQLECKSGLFSRMAAAEKRLESVSEFARENREVNNRIQKEHKNNLMLGFKALQDQFSQLESSAKKTQASLESFTTDTRDFRSIAETSLKELRTEAAASKETQDFLMTATEMLKRKSREFYKSTDGRFKELTDEQEKILQQLIALERLQKTMQREAVKGDVGHVRGMRSASMDARHPDGSDCLLDQLQKIATGGITPLDQLNKIATSAPAQQEQALALMDAARPPLPWFDADGRPCTQGLDLASLPRFPSPAPGVSRPASVCARARLSSTPRSKSARAARK